MNNGDREFRPRDSWMPAIAMLTLSLLVTAGLLNGIGKVGVMAPSHAGRGQTIELPDLPAEAKVPFARVDKAIERLHLTETGRPEQFEAYEPLLLALSQTLSGDRGTGGLDRVRLLLDRSLPAPAAREIARMLPPFLAYQHAQQSLLELTPGAPGSIEGAYLHLLLQHALRQEFLGEGLASRLYSTNYRMAELHLVRRMLMLREDLDEDQKRRLIRERIETTTANRRQEGAG